MSDRKSIGTDESHSLNNKKPDDTRKSGGRGGGVDGGVGVCVGGGGGVCKTPLIQVTRASYSVDARPVLPGVLDVRPAHTKDQGHAGHVDETTAKTAEKTDREAASEAKTEAPRLGAPLPLANVRSSSTQQRQRQQQQQQQPQTHPRFPGVLMVLIATLLVVLGLIFIAVRFMIIGFCLVIFGTLLVLCGSLYLVHCCIETLKAKRQENFRAMALGRGSNWLTKPPPNRRCVTRQMNRCNSIAMSNTSDEKVEAIEDLNPAVHEALLLLRETDTANVTKATVTMPPAVATLKIAKTSAS